MRFNFARISTDEFAIVNEKYDTSQETTVNANMGFGINTSEKLLVMQVKFVMLQKELTVAVLTITCFFRILPEDWDAAFNKDSNQLTVAKGIALHFAMLTVGTARGVFHGKTEKHPVNTLVIPPIDVNDFIKSDLVLAGAHQTSANTLAE